MSRRPPRNCVVCGRWFTPRDDRHCICSGDCRLLRRRLLCRLWYNVPENRRRQIANVIRRRKENNP